MTNTCYSHPKQRLVTTLQRLYEFGLTTTSGGNISIRDDAGNIWITPAKIDKGALRPEDIVKVSPDGTVTGLHNPSCELPFHRSVYSLRPDVKSVLHAHSPALVAFSLVGRCPDLSVVSGAAEVCGITRFAAYEIPGSERLGRVLANEFADGADCVVMENHGAVVCGATLEQAFARFETLDRLARIALLAAGHDPLRANPAPRPANSVREETFTPRPATPEECELRNTLSVFSARACRQKLLFNAGGFLSARLGHDDFLLTPDAQDPLLLSPMDLIRFSQGRVPAGTSPSASASAPLCRAVYRACPWANALFLTRSPNVMAFASSGQTINSRTIPESYIMLRDIPLVPTTLAFHDPDALAKMLTPSTPVLLMEHYGLLTTGATILEAFDRMEVGEFTAKCLLLAARIGEMRPIEQTQVDEIIDTFHLPV